MTHSAQSSMITVPEHLVGTRAALFHLLRITGRRPVAAEVQILRPAAQIPSFDPVRAALQADVFVFAKSA